MKKLDKIIERTGEFRTMTSKQVFNSVGLNEEKGMSEFFVTEKGKELLAELIQVKTLENHILEKKVGRFRTDILFYSPEIHSSEDMQHNVVIENQFGSTDHAHLGKMITYASNENIKKLVWIADEEKLEHVKAIEWLNENSKPDVEFFLAVLNFVEIDNFEKTLIPILKPVVLPQINRKNNLTTKQNDQMEFWKTYKELLSNDVDGLIQPRPQHWYDHYRNGITHTHVTNRIIWGDSASVGIWNFHNDARYDYIMKNIDDLSIMLGIPKSKIIGDPKHGAKASEVKVVIAWKENSELQKEMKELFLKFTEFLVKHKEKLKELK